MWVWSKLSSAKWEDAWEERFHGNPNLVLARLKGGKSVRVDVYCSERAKAEEIAEQLLEAFPDFHAETVRVFGEGEWVCGQYVYTGTMKGPLTGPDGKEIPATNKKLNMRALQIVTAHEGKITDIVHYFDMMTMMTQLGLAG